MTAAGQAGVPLSTVGKFGGSDVSFGGVSAPLDELSALSKSVFADHFA